VRDRTERRVTRVITVAAARTPLALARARARSLSVYLRAGPGCTAGAVEDSKAIVPARGSRYHRVTAASEEMRKSTGTKASERSAARYSPVNDDRSIDSRNSISRSSRMRTLPGACACSFVCLLSLSVIARILSSVRKASRNLHAR